MRRKKKKEIASKEIKTKKYREELLVKKLKLLAVGLGVMLVATFLFFTFSEKTACGAALISEEQAKNIALKTIKGLIDSSNIDVSILSVKNTGSNFEINLTLSVNGQSQEYTSYLSLDGKYFYVNGVKTSKYVSGALKKAVPDVELFVMAYCPYGTQMEKAILPVVSLLDDKVNFSVKFVYYAMHGKKEIDEQLRQYCIQKEYNDKYLDYLSCFLEDGNYSECLARIGISEDDIASCVNKTDEEYNITGMYNDRSTWIGNFPQFPIFKKENAEYGVQGSPTLVINGEQVTVARNPKALLEKICEAFTEKPQECSTVLSSDVPAPGFGYEGVGTGSGSCG